VKALQPRLAVSTRLACLGLVAVSTAAVACGGGSTDSLPPSNPQGPSATTTTTTTPPAPSAGASNEKVQAAMNAPYDDPEDTGNRALTPLVAKGTPASAFPAKQIDEGACWSMVQHSGKHAPDYAALAAACGTPGGLLEYVHPVSGKLHSVKDKRDVFTVPLIGGYCYRYFAVADDTIRDIDILVQKPGGALVADDKQTQPIAIIEAQKSWCMPKDETYEFHVLVDGDGAGAYTLGIWARPQ
jgi:hypothetical protein